MASREFMESFPAVANASLLGWARPMTSLPCERFERPHACSTQKTALSAWSRGVVLGSCYFELLEQTNPAFSKSYH